MQAVSVSCPLFELHSDIICLIFRPLLSNLKECLRSVRALRRTSKKMIELLCRLGEPLVTMILAAAHEPRWQESGGGYIYPSQYESWALLNYPNYIRQYWKPEIILNFPGEFDVSPNDVEFPDTSCYAIDGCADRPYYRSENSQPEQDKVLEHALEASHLIAKQKLSGIFLRRCNQLLAFVSLTSSKAQCHLRLISFTADFRIAKTPLLNVHLLPSTLCVPRELNEYERKLFRFFDDSDATKPVNELVPSPVICSRAEFLSRMEHYFAFSHWKSFIPWKRLFLVGGSVLRLISAVPFELDKEDVLRKRSAEQGEDTKRHLKRSLSRYQKKEKSKATERNSDPEIEARRREAETEPLQDLDFFFCGEDYYQYEKSFERFTDSVIKASLSASYPYSLLRSPKDENLSYVRTVTLRRKKSFPASLPLLLRFQFIWYDNLHRGEILSIFDLDCCQVGFDGENVLASPAALQSLCTRTMISYKLVPNKEDLASFLPRTRKYQRRGFRLLVPLQFDRTMLPRLHEEREEGGGGLTELKDMREVDKYAGFLLNNDSFQMRQKWTRILDLSNEQKEKEEEDADEEEDEHYYDTDSD